MQMYDTAWLDRVLARAPVRPQPPPPIDVSQIKFETCDTLGVPSWDDAFSHLRLAIECPDGQDRSADTFKAACLLLESGYSDAQIIGLLLNPDNPISAHCIEKTNPVRAAQLAIGSAKRKRDTATSPPLNTATPIIAKPYVWRDPATLPKREWLYGKQLLRGTLSVIIAPGGAGKSSLAVGMALSIVRGAELLGQWVAPRRLKAWYWPLEDSGDEIARSVQAAALYHGLGEIDLAAGLYINSALDGDGLCFARQGKDGADIDEAAASAITTQIIENQIDVLIIDPFVSAHLVNENDNGAIDAIAKRLARIAVEANCAVLVIHHSRKTNGTEIDAESARGASALVNAARNVMTLNRMTEKEAGGFNLNKDELHSYFRTFNAKANRTPPSNSSDWYKLESVALGNGDTVGVVAPWYPQPIDDDITDERRASIIAKISEGNYRKNSQATDWVGHAIASIFGWDAKIQRSQINSIVEKLIKDGTLIIKEASGKNRKLKDFIRVAPSAIKDAPPPPLYRGGCVV
jgi:hypothetical protein